MKLAVLIVGGGLFGSVARDLLLARGIECQVIDDQRPMSGSFPAGCLMKPSWLNGLGRTASVDALTLLDELYGLRRILLRFGPGALKTDSVSHVAPMAILREPDIVGKVISVDPDSGTVLLDDNRTFRADVVLVAAGSWCAELLPEHFRNAPLKAVQGQSLRFRGAMPEGRLEVWAPYKQSVAFEITQGVVWFGDGTALQPESWTASHDQRTLQHAARLGLSTNDLIEVRSGFRPYVRGRTGWFERAGRKCWVSTNGAKNGVALAAVQALQFLEAIK